MTALIDVIFLLLLFFMLSSTFSQYSEIELSAVGSGGDSVEAETMGFLRLTGNDLRLNGAPTPPEDLLTRIETFGVQTLAVSVSDTVDAQRLVDLLALLRGAPDLTVVVLRGA